MEGTGVAAAMLLLMIVSGLAVVTAALYGTAVVFALTTAAVAVAVHR